MRGSSARSFAADPTLARRANPHANPERQVDFAGAALHCGILLTQVVNHHDLPVVSRFIETAAKRAVDVLASSVCSHRSANAKTLNLLQFPPGAVEGLTRSLKRERLPRMCAPHAQPESMPAHGTLHQQPAGRARLAC
jgi:hypothetical protein